MSDWKFKNSDTRPVYPVESESSGRRKIAWLGWIIAAAALLYFMSPWIARAFLELSRSANESAYYDTLSQYMSEAELLTLPTHTPLPTYTPMPTFTSLPTYTPVPTATSTPTPTPVPPAFIIQQLETQAQLVVVKNELTRRSFHVGLKDGLCSHGADFTAQGVIEAGIDFDKIDEDSVAYNPRNQTYTLKLPAPEFTSCRIEYIRLVKNSFSMCNPDWDRARTLAEVQVMKDFVADSQEDGLIDDAAERTEIILGEFVRSITGKRVNVTFEKQGGAPKRDASCRPRALGGWRYNASKNTWQK
ncbi:MAG: DUF4230 domain-containing protein [Chloroflexota bacterium]|nr:DUF4230 domain-containing protein [Chloroflexota bacterium]MDE2853166.1 DUF4230 domain-containing protein [Chloroflexota bacterium]MDE2948708.1 DUF4230 domain-containing protein [Chloroflexota bacterium]